MTTFKKKYIMELVGGDIYAGGNDKSTNNNSEIETGPVQKSYNDNSDYERGESPTTDKVVRRYRQDIPWFANFSYGGGLRNNRVSTFENTKNILKKKAVEEKIEDLVSKSKISDLNPKDYNPKVAKLIDTINDADLTEKQLEDLKKAIQNKEIKHQGSKNL